MVKKEDKKIPFLCKLFGHKLRFKTSDVSGEAVCKRKGCDYVKPGIRWPGPYDSGINAGDIETLCSFSRGSDRL
jgi:hypothetical protein